MTEFFKDQDLFNFGANVIANCTVDATKDDAPVDAPETKHHGLKLRVFEALFPMLTSIKKSPIKRMKISEGVKNLMFNYHNHKKEIKDLDVVLHLGKAILEANLDEVADVLEEGTKMHDKWMEVYTKREELKVDVGDYKDALNHCLMDSLVLLANEEDFLLIMHEYGIESLFEIVNFQRYIKEEKKEEDFLYKSFMGDAKVNDKVTIILNQIIAVLGSDNVELEVEQDCESATPDVGDN